METFNKYKYLQNEMMSNSFWKDMTTFSFMWDVDAMELVKLDIKKQHYSLFIKY